MINLPKNLIWLGTALSFSMGINYWNSDFAFTVTNVVSHGVAYMGLVWLSDASRVFQRPGARAKFWLRFGPILFLASLLVLAYIEEGFWDSLVWNEHGNYFAWFHSLIGDGTSDSALSWLVPLLALPQATHYIWDGFIWKKPEALPLLKS